MGLKIFMDYSNNTLYGSEKVKRKKENFDNEYHTIFSFTIVSE